MQDARPAVLVHGADQARLALRLATPRGVLLLSPPGLLARAGIGWFLALIDAVRTDSPGTPCDAALDCGAHAGLALAAIRAGAPVVILAPDCQASPAVSGAAAEAGVPLWTAAPPALDLGGVDLRRRDSQKSIATWLAAIGSPREQGMPPAR